MENSTLLRLPSGHRQRGEEVRLADDGDELKDMFGEPDIAGYRDFGAGRLSADALGEKAPRNGLRDDDVRSDGGWKLLSVAPAIARPEKAPLATTITRNLDKERCIDCGNNISVGMRKTAQKGVQNRMVEGRSHNARPICGEADLLLMVPALGEFAGSVEPDERSSFSGP